MKIAYAALAIVSAAFFAFSWFSGNEMRDLRSDLWAKDDRASRSRAEADLRWTTFERNRSDLHSRVKLVSVVYYLGASVVFIFGGLNASGRKPWRIARFAGSAVALLMAAFSILLSGKISFDEVFVAWLATTVVLAILALASVWAPTRPPGQQTTEQSVADVAAVPH